jgi:hypothetical protein
LARSRGGLVARYAFENKWNGKADAPLLLDRLVMTATPNQGTHLVNSKHWKDMINIVTNLLGKAFLPSSPAFDTVGVVLKAIVNGVLKLPGLDDQQIGGPFLTDLNKDLPAGSLKNYFVATSNYEPGRVLAAFFDQILYDEKIFRDALNDKVVPVDSARMQLAHAEGLGALPQENVLPCGQSERINHFAYLRSKHKISVEWVVEKLTKG